MPGVSADNDDLLDDSDESESIDTVYGCILTQPVRH